MTYRTRVPGDGRFQPTAGRNRSAQAHSRFPRSPCCWAASEPTGQGISALSTIALLFTALTTVLLVWDLEHKSRFLRVIFTPQTKSWLARGAFILIAYSGLTGVFWLAAIAQFTAITTVLLWPTVLLGFLAAAYTAFLFGQCEGRDLWQTPLLPLHLIVQALMCGAAVLALLPSSAGGSQQTLAVAKVGLAIQHHSSPAHCRGRIHDAALDR